MQKVGREVLLSQLESVSPGLSIKAEFEQSHCFVFKDHKIFTFNDEIRCVSPSCLNGIEGAVYAKPLLAILQKMPDDEVEVTTTKNRFRVKAGGRKADIVRQRDIVLEYDSIDKPKEWHELHPDFLEGAAMIVDCASDDQSAYIYTCVRITPTYIEAMDGWQAGRYKVDFPTDEPIYIRKSALKHIIELDMESVSIGERWAHFRSSDGLMLSCRVSRDEDYADLGPVLEIEGKSMALSKSLVQVAERAEILCEDEDKYLTVTIEKGRVVVVTESDEGRFRESRKLRGYKGPSRVFMISSHLLSKICDKYNEVIISEDKIGVSVGAFQYVTVLKVDNI